MGTYFSDIVEKAVEDLYYCYAMTGQGKRRTV